MILTGGTGILYAQSDGLQIKFLNISITDSTVYNHLPADFPYPVLSLIQIKDNYQHYIHGLAAMDTWLGPDDITEIGLPVNDVWKVITERHRYEDNYPPNQNVKEMMPQFMVAELSQVEGYGVSMALAMDYSGSMGAGIAEAEKAARYLVRKINKNDEVAILKITASSEVYQNFTSDTTLLMQAINTPTPDGGGTLLNQGIYDAVQLCAGARGRRAVVVYTDGLNDMPGPAAQEIIDLAKSMGVIVFTIGLGDEIDEEDLGEIAIETGGYYRRTPSPASLGLIYQQIYHYINGFYALAHTSTDPFYNGTWRRVDVDIESEQHLKGHGWGSYYVPFLPRNVRVHNKVVSDSVMVFEGDTLYFATSEDLVNYTLTVNCDGPGIAHDIVLKNVPDSHVLPVSFEVDPDTVIGDTLIWKIARMDGDTQLRFDYQARVSTYLPMQTVELVNRAFINCPFDSIPGDNESNSILLAKGHPDFVVRCMPPPGLASPGHPLSLPAMLYNWGNASAVVPVSVRFYLGSPGAELLDEVIVPSLNFSDSVRVTGVWSEPVEGVHEIFVVADELNEIKELREQNNQDSCTIQVGIDDLQMQISGIHFGQWLRNVQGRFPEQILTRVNVLDQNLHTVFGLANASQWIGTAQPAETGLPSGSHWSMLTESPWTCQYPVCRTDVREGMRITEIRQDTFSVVFLAENSQSMQGWRQQAQLEILHIMDPEKDWGAVIGLGASVELLQGFTQDTMLLSQAFQSHGQSQNQPVYEGCMEGIELAADRSGRRAVIAMVSGQEQGGSQSSGSVISASLDQCVPVYVIQIGSSPANPDFKTLADTSGGWYFQISHQDDASGVTVLLRDMLRNYYGLSHASPDTLRNETLRRIHAAVDAFGVSAGDAGVYRAPAGYADLAIEKTGQALSMYLEQDETIPKVQPGDSVAYTVTVRNTGHYDLTQIQVTDLLPDNLILSRASSPYTATGNNSVRWTIETLPVFTQTRITYTCFVDTVPGAPAFLMTNRASVSHSHDEIDNNNFSDAVIRYIPLRGPDVRILKTGRADSSVIVRQDSVFISDPGDTVHYTIQVINHGEMLCHETTVTDTLSRWVNLIGIPDGADYQDGVLSWTLGPLASRGGFVTLSYTCDVDTFLPPWDEMIINTAHAAASEDLFPGDNTVSDTMWVVGLLPPGPQIQVSRSQIEPGDSVGISVMTPIYIEGWDLVVFYEDGYENRSYADAFISQHDLNPAQWIDIAPVFDETYMRTAQKHEMIGFVIETFDVWGSVRADTAYVNVRSSDEFALDRNVFRPGHDGNLQLRFKLSSNRYATVHIFDLSGHHICELAGRAFLAGWNELVWSGADKSGRFIGSGVYLAVLEAGDYRQAKKFIVVR
ncbi:DUF11 domain-containing protein [bacterium]|nr:DUF11 domain-containing protein [bacterium]